MVVDGNAKICRDTCASRHRFYQTLPAFGWVHDGCTKSPAPGETLCVECLESSAERSKSLSAEQGRQMERGEGNVDHAEGAE